ncbi:MAG: Acetamidase, partial [Verrucomicrobiota bacterium]
MHSPTYPVKFCDRSWFVTRATLGAGLMLALAANLTAGAATIVAENYHLTLSAKHPVLSRIRTSEHIVTRTLCASGRDEQGVSRADRGNPLTGPFFIEGAEPGDAVVIHIKKLRLSRNWGFSSSRLGLFALTPETIAAMHPMYAIQYK